MDSTDVVRLMCEMLQVTFRMMKALGERLVQMEKQHRSPIEMGLPGSLRADVACAINCSDRLVAKRWGSHSYFR
jgi:hypothetical protein